MKIGLYDSGMGILPFLKVILKDKILNDYYILIDHNNFPYGNRSDAELLKILEKNINYAESLNLDYLLICCNTMSKIYLDYQIKTKLKIITILEINLKYPNYHLLATSSLSRKIDNAISAHSLADYIESNNIKKIINTIKKINVPIILSCTHYHLLKDILPYYKINYLSKEEEIFFNIPKGNNLNIYINKKDESLLKKYLKIGIKYY